MSASMELSIPIVIEKITPATDAAFYRARPVFVPGFEQTDAREDRAVRRLQDDLRKAALSQASGIDHGTLTQWSYHPKLQHRRLDLVIGLRRHTLRSRIFLVTFEALGRTVAMSPQLPGLSFEIWPGENVEERATEVLTEHFKVLEKHHENLNDYQFSDIVYAHLDSVHLKIQSPREIPEDDDEGPSFALLGDAQKVSGAQELERTGRCLNRLYPNDLERALCRESEVTGLLGWFEQARGAEAPAPIVLVGPNQSGKTAILHETIRRLLEKRGAKTGQVWLLSPQRLISGMSFLGQWEQRVIAILEESAKERHVLYFDDLIGLFHAGKSRDSNLTVGQVLKLHLEEGKLRVIGEATSAAWRKLREIDRGFADLFRVVQIREPADLETCRILIRTLQDMEQLHGCRFAPEVLPLVIELPRRFVRGRAFPGKGAEMLRQLAAAHPGAAIGKSEVFRHFETKTGVRQRFMDRQQVLETRTVEAFFQDRIVGQRDAIAAMVDAIVLAKAQLNDPNRPIASLLFLGPTGVGKTECAKALAEYYFGSADRLLRFDMNEYGGWDSVARLIGTFGGRQGALTGAVRRRPHAVLLLDEIEKAHPDVIDLLLQVLDDGRLTDANGVTSDFCNIIIVLTSNLGAQEAKSRVGFGAENLSDGVVYADAARKFFRPEFFNRLDRVVAFHELGREHIEGIVFQLVKRALERHGLRQRKMSISVDPAVYDLLAGLGFVREFGARALRRAIEDQLVEPIATELCAVSHWGPAFIQARVVEGRIRLIARTLRAVERVVFPGSIVGAVDALDLVDRANDYLQRIQADMDAWQEPDEDHATPIDQHYYLVKEQLVRVRQLRDRLEASAEALQEGGRATAAVRAGRQPKAHIIPPGMYGDVLEEIFLGADPARLLQELAEGAPVEDEVSEEAHHLTQQAALVEYLSQPQLAEPDRFLIRFQVNGAELLKADAEERFELYQNWIESYLELLRNEPAVSWKILSREAGKPEPRVLTTPSIARFLTEPSYFLYGEGPGFLSLLEREQGLQLFCYAGQRFEYGGIELIALQPGETLAEACDRALQAPLHLLERTTEVFRLRHEKGWVYDLKTGILTRDRNVPLWTFLGPLLEAPAEFGGKADGHRLG
jgi:ATP-dependent Clp protease ATP-binding subunit ClpA